MPQTSRALSIPLDEEQPLRDVEVHAGLRKPPASVQNFDPLLTAEGVAKRLNVSTDWVWDHSSCKKPLLPVIRMGDGTLRYRASGIEHFIDEHERLSSLCRRTNKGVSQ